MKIFAAAAIGACLLAPSVVAQEQPSASPIARLGAIMGRWWTQDHDGVVDIEPCAAGLCGRVVGITQFGPDGATPVDNHGRSRCKLQIINDGSAESDGITWDSHITDPDDGRVYTITLRLDQGGRLRMRGYIGIPLLGRTVFWTRFTGRLTADCHIV